MTHEPYDDMQTLHKDRVLRIRVSPVLLRATQHRNKGSVTVKGVRRALTTRRSFIFNIYLAVSNRGADKSERARSDSAAAPPGKLIAA